MQGTILVIDGVSTNRIMLKAQLTAAYFRVEQTESASAALAAARACRPDLVLTALTLPDGSAADVKRALARDETLADVPVIAVSPENCAAARLQALSEGLDDVLPQPVDDVILQARIRSLLRLRSASEELNLQRAASHGFVLPLSDRAACEDLRGAVVALVAQSAVTAARWKAQLAARTHYDLRTHQIGDIHPLLSEPVPEVIVIELDEAAPGPGLRLLADLRARAATRQSVVIAVPNPANAHLAAEALDRGAHDVLQSGFDASELALRLGTQLQHKRRTDLLRTSVRDGLRAAVEDPMTGLFNRRYAKPFLDRVAAEAAETSSKFAVMLADLDHFKQINDRYGHPAGDAVLVEAAQRLKAQLPEGALLARIGGEEFMAVLPGVSEIEAGQAAVALCNAINGTPFRVPGAAAPVTVTISVGAVIGGRGSKEPREVNDLIAAADRALYSAKEAGRNQVTLSPQQPAAA
ncbi:diguanylate cyclase domain-containing protein [Roseobacteraceae bacterium NS-SX3]